MQSLQKPTELDMVPDSPIKLQKKSQLADLIFGSAAGFTGKIFEYPFDTIKVHLQTQQKHSLWKCINTIYKKEGVSGFFAGISAPLIGSMAENAVLFLSYNAIQKYMRQHYGLSETQDLTKGQTLLAGSLAGTVVSFVITPVELLKCRLQTQGYLKTADVGIRHPGPVSVCYHILRTEGLTGLYKGHVGTMLRETAGGAAWFGSYEYCIARLVERSKTAQSKADLKELELMAAGAVAGMSYNAAFFPADVVKSRMQSGLHQNESFLSVTRSIYVSYGIGGFFRGFNLTVLRSAPSSGIIFLTYVPSY